MLQNSEIIWLAFGERREEKREKESSKLTLSDQAVKGNGHHVAFYQVVGSFFGGEGCANKLQRAAQYNCTQMGRLR